MTYQFRGRGGGGGGGGGGGSVQAAHQQVDTLRSKDTFETVIGLCEGPIAGLVDGAKSFMVGETALVSVDGNLNFANFTLNFFEGNDDPSYTIKPTLGGLASSMSVGTTLSQNVPLVRQTQIGDIDYIDVRSVINQLYSQNSDGVYTNTIEFAVQIKPHDATVWCGYANVGATVISVMSQSTKTTEPRAAAGSTDFLYDRYSVATQWDAVAAPGANVTISGKTTSNYVRQFRLPVIPTNGTWDIRLVKISANSDGSSHFCEMTWESFQEVVAVGQWKFPNTACIQVYGQASNQFTSLPDFSGIYKGLLVNVPTNYDPETKTYEGTWDGTFKKAWTDNNAWCVYDLVTNTRYGMSSYLPVHMDKWSTYEAGQWCDQRVASGRPRYTFNGIIQNPRSVRDQVLYMAGAFNAVFFTDQNGTAYLKVDKDEAATQLFTLENTVEGFNYSFTDVTSRYNDITITFNNPDLAWQEDRRRVFDQDLIDTHGRIPLDFVAVGCIYEEEAMRRGQYKLVTANTEKMLCTFKTNRQGLYVPVFGVLLVADPDLGYGISGRIKTLSADRRVITLRDPVYLEVGIDYQIQVTIPNGLITANLVGATAGYNFVLNLDNPLPPNTPEYANFAIAQEGGGIGLPKPFRVVKISEADGTSDNIEVSCIEVNRNKWYSADNLADLPEPQHSYLPDPTVVPGPTEVVFKEYFVPKTMTFHLLVEPVLDRGSYRYYNGDFEVWARPKGTPGTGGYEKLTMTADNSVINPTPGATEFKVLPVNTLGKMAQLDAVLSFDYTVTNPKAPPSDVVSFTGTVTPYGIDLDWTAVPDIDTSDYRLWHGETFESATQMTTLAALHLGTGLKVAGTHTFWIAAVDFLGNTSVNPKSCSVTVNAPAAPVASGATMGSSALITWTVPASQFALGYYEILEGDTFESAASITTAKSTTFTTAVDWGGSKRFWVVAYDVADNRGVPASVDIVSTAPGATMVTVQTIDNNVLLKWTEVTSQLPVVSFEIRRGDVLPSAVVVGQKTGTFTTIFEEAAGVYSYWVAAIDSAGNYGAWTKVTASVAQPPDYVLFQNWSSSLGGAVVNASVINGVLSAPINIDETVSEHFDDHFWGTPQDQIDAGFPIYIQPTNLTGSYVEIFDYETVIPSTKVTLDVTRIVRAGVVTMTPTISISVDGTTWTDYPNTFQVFASGFRYVKVMLEFSSSDNTGLMDVTQLVVRLDVKQKSESGASMGYATDVGGTEVLFTTEFIDVTSIIVTPSGTTPVSAVYDFDDVPNPTGFKVLLFDNAGARVTGPFSWTVKGV